MDRQEDPLKSKWRAYDKGGSFNSRTKYIYGVLSFISPLKPNQAKFFS